MWAASLSALKLPLNLRATQSALQQVRNIYKKRYYRGVFLKDGMECHKGDVLVRTWKFQYYPGLNVAFCQELSDKVLRASCDGKVMITTEKIDPDFSISDIDEAYNWRTEVIENGATKVTFNVIPNQEVGKFRLKECV